MPDAAPPSGASQHVLLPLPDVRMKGIAASPPRRNGTPVRRLAGWLAHVGLQRGLTAWQSSAADRPAECRHAMPRCCQARRYRGAAAVVAAAAAERPSICLSV